jgi:hypothetical protein
MNNRYNELSKVEQEMFDLMINSVASHRNSFGGDLTKKTYYHFRSTERELWADENPVTLDVFRHKVTAEDKALSELTHNAKEGK